MATTSSIAIENIVAIYIFIATVSSELASKIKPQLTTAAATIEIDRWTNQDDSRAPQALTISGNTRSTIIDFHFLLNITNEVFLAKQYIR